ncbi:hybrid sensor histidine kinase/response regulator [Sphingomonas quercus]|uniref:histidine kinase n=1 Tax=Sphingomonas quercus TaxID=2842451 RepID=A0ABS6BGK5_9SPHN|nr:response regulator [Sphingomonas quercus]MBU3077432.1 response regulator [Sphingomonas quercus]
MPASPFPSFVPEPTRSRRVLRFAVFGVVASGLASAAFILWLFGEQMVAAGFVAAFLALAVVALVVEHLQVRRVRDVSDPDWALFRAIADNEGEAVAITNQQDALVCASGSFGHWFGGLVPPPRLSLPDGGGAALAAAGLSAWRDGEARLIGLAGPNGLFDVRVTRAGRRDDHLIWRFAHARSLDVVGEARAIVQGRYGVGLGEGGAMAAVVDADGRLLACNTLFATRALGGPSMRPEGLEFSQLFATRGEDQVHLAAEPAGPPLRFIRMSLPGDDGAGASLFLMLDEKPPVQVVASSSNNSANPESLLGILPLGLALADRDGRFLFLNAAFRKAAGLGPEEAPVYPSDLVVKDDKAVVADAVRRFAMGQSVPGDVAVRLKRRAEEPVALTIAPARGLGDDAAILLSLKDNSEESRLKRQVAQATKMQAVGQLAGGVAHDFNNILTAIIGYCDLMLMRHAPGDSDYDDIQQIKHNSNRAAGLTRQLLAFSRQQTLRPQVLQLSDVVAEVSNLLKRLLGERMTLVTKHGRNLGAVRADPGQIEQVIVNLAVNARDAMPDGGALTIQTYAVSADEVRRMGHEMMPIGDYTALSVTDTGHGIPASIIGNIFEPFFTTKEVGKGTGLGLSTVYGIVKQSGGFIFAESPEEGGARFVMYLPVHRSAKTGESEGDAAPVRERPTELWGTGNILLVEDEDMVRAVAERALVRQGYRVRTAANGEDALEMLEANADPIDLLISDVMMPSMDGPTLAGHARRLMPDLPILFMSGYAEEQLRKSIDLDRVHFLPKPFSVQQLAEAARDVLAMAPVKGGLAANQN